MGRLTPDPVDGPWLGWQVHDLLLVDVRGLGSPGGGPLPDAALTASTVGATGRAWVVVRRAEVGAGRIPVGIRGSTRAERWPAVLEADRVLAVVHPWSIGLAAPATRVSLPAVRSLTAVAEHDVLAEVGRWGPAGSVGFELATRSPVVTGTSDLDLVVHAARPLDRERCRLLARDTESLPARVDIMVETPWGGFAMDEWLRGDGSSVVLRTARGPVVVGDPWGRP